MFFRPCTSGTETMPYFQRFFLLTGIAFLTVSGSTLAADTFGADRHVAKGVACTVCHGKDMNNIEYPDETTCVKCHPKATVTEKTKKFNPNPHAAPHNGECTLCHMQHEAPVNYCNQCHKFDFGKIP